MIRSEDNMYYKDNDFDGNSKRGGGNYSNNGYADKEIKPVTKFLDEDYVDQAEKVILKLKNNYKTMVTTTKIRGLLSGMSDIYNDVVRLADNNLPPKINSKIQYLRVQFAYEYGRSLGDNKDKSVKNFIEASHLMDYLQMADGSRDRFIQVERYMEALVAYNRYYGGRDE